MFLSRLFSLFGLLLCLVVAFADVRGAEPAAARGAVAEPAGSRITGQVLNAGSGRPAEYVAVSLKSAGGREVQGTATDEHGRFSFEKIPPGDYVVSYGLVGTVPRQTEAFTVETGRPNLDLGGLKLSGEIVQIAKFEVQARKDKQLGSVDRKVYNVGQEIQGTTGSASDLLQNVPSVDVGVNGNVSLRGSENVLILIDGRTSTLMGRSQADVLQQLPADAIDKIEVITNPSAKYKPDGTAGIINIALKRRHDAGLSGSWTVSAGSGKRGGVGLNFNYRPGLFNVYGSYNVRQDDRPRTATDIRTITDPITGVVTEAEKRTVEHSRPVSHLVRAGLDYAPDRQNQFSLNLTGSHRSFFRVQTDHNLFRDLTGALTSDYDRFRLDPEVQSSQEIGASYRHNFGEDDHELNLEAKASAEDEKEPDHYRNIYRLPVQAPSADNVIIKNQQSSREAIVGYVRPLGSEARLESGYDLTVERRDMDFYNEYLDAASGLWVKDLVKSNRFILDRSIHAFYGTYSRSFGPLAVLAGVRPELVSGQSNLVTTGQVIPNDYNRVYPSLHLTYHLDDSRELQLNYSHRVHRPETEDLNPFPEYLDPYTLRAGNSRLQPEDIHSVETGYGYRHEDTSLTATAYYRYTYHGFTSVTTNLGNGVLLNSRQNLAVNRASGLEFTANSDFGRTITLNTSANVFFNTIDASNLGYSSSRSDVAWMAKLGVSWRWTKDTQLQFNTSYNSARLTPQGERRPTFIANLGLRHELWKKRAALVLTVSDLFNTLREEYVVDTPVLREDVIRRRSARVIYLGYTYNFGQPAKKSKDDQLKYDNSL